MTKGKVIFLSIRTASVSPVKNVDATRQISSRRQKQEDLRPLLVLYDQLIVPKQCYVRNVCIAAEPSRVEVVDPPRLVL